MAMWDLSQQCKAGLTCKNQFNIIYHAKKLKLKTCRIISIDAENVFEKKTRNKNSQQTRNWK